MMLRTQIYLDPELHRRAKGRAAERGISLAEYVREALAADLSEDREPVDRSVIFNLGDSGGSDVARQKDRYVADAVAAERSGGSRDRRGR